LNILELGVENNRAKRSIRTFVLDISVLIDAQSKVISPSVFECILIKRVTKGH